MILADIRTAQPGDWTRTVYLDASATALHTGLFVGGDATLFRQRIADGGVFGGAVVETRRLYLFSTLDGDVVRQTREQANWERVAAISPELCPVIVDGHTMIAGRTYREVPEP